MGESAKQEAKAGSGIFIVFEGIDGAGKSTQAVLLKKRLEEQGRRVTFVKEPTAGQWGQKIKEIARNGRQGVTLEEELDYFIFDREEDVEQNIRPALARGDLVLADRYFYSNIVYQTALGLDPKEIRRRNSAFPVPDLVIILDISPELSAVRINSGRQEGANLGYEQSGYLAKVKQAYNELDDPNIVRLDGSASIEAVGNRIWETVLPLLKMIL
ncbi:MAG: dTMP kinase [Deltaproteobacteria bacterium]|nr:dTMP kinase [Deltaproteobacteria bacterium]